MKRSGLIMTAILVLPMILACGSLGGILGGGDNYKPAAQLWSDVPRMDGLTASEAEDLPLPVKLLMRTILGNLGRLNAEGEDQTTGNIDWISFKSSAPADEIGRFYSPELMAASGWEQGDGSNCMSGDAEGLTTGAVLCAFGKKENGKDISLAIIATQDESTKETSVFFLRLETEESATQ